MNSDIEFTMDLNTSPAEQKLNQFQDKMKMADAAFERMQTAQSNQARKLEYWGLNQPSQGSIGSYSNVNPSQFGMINPSTYSAGAYEQLAKITIQQQKTALRKAIRQAQTDGRGDDALNASEKLNRLENVSKLGKESNIVQGEITDETKSQNREYNEHYIKLSKLHKLLLAILAVWKSMQQIAKSVIGRASEVNENLGYFSIDRQGAFYANVDKTRAMVYAGMRNMGNANPLSKSDYDAIASRWQEARTTALTGQGLDKNFATAMDVLHGKFGLGLSAEQLYTKGNVNLTEIENRDLAKLENEVIPALAKLPDRERDQLTKYLTTIYGSNVLNALMANRNLRDANADIPALIDRLLAHGENEISNVNVSKYSSELADSFAELKESWKELGDVLLMDFFPAIKAVTGGLVAFVDWLRSKFNWTPEDVIQDKIEGESVVWGGANMLHKQSHFYDVANPFGDNRNADVKETLQYFKNVNRKAEAAEILRNARRTGTISFADAYKMVAFSSDAAQQGILGQGLESANIDNQLRAVYQMYRDKTLMANRWDPRYANKLQGELGALAYSNLSMFGDTLTYEEFIQNLDEQELTKIFKRHYGEDGDLDFKASYLNDPAAYVTMGLTAQQAMSAIKRISETLNLDSTGGKLTIKTADVQGGVDVNITLSDTSGSTTTERLRVPVSSTQSTMDHIKANLGFSTSTLTGGR